MFELTIDSEQEGRDPVKVMRWNSISWDIQTRRRSVFIIPLENQLKLNLTMNTHCENDDLELTKRVSI